MSTGDAEPVAVKREIVLDVLRAHHVEIAPSENDPGVSKLFKDGIAEGQHLPTMIPKKLLQRFSYKFNIPIHHFFHPELAPKL